MFMTKGKSKGDSGIGFLAEDEKNNTAGTQGNNGGRIVVCVQKK